MVGVLFTVVNSVKLLFTTLTYLSPQDYSMSIMVSIETAGDTVQGTLSEESLCLIVIQPSYVSAFPRVLFYWMHMVSEEMLCLL